MGEESKSTEMFNLLKEILVLTRAAYLPDIRERMERLLDTDEKRKAYHYSDNRSSKEIEEVSGINYVQITEMWKVWHRNGLGYMKSVKGGKRFVRDISLDDVGIQLP